MAFIMDKLKQPTSPPLSKKSGETPHPPWLTSGLASKLIGTTPVRQQRPVTPVFPERGETSPETSPDRPETGDAIKRRQSTGTFKSAKMMRAPRGTMLRRSTTGTETFEEEFLLRANIMLANTQENEPENASPATKVVASVSSTPPQPPTGLALPIDQQPKSANGVPIVAEACIRYLTKNASDCVGLFRVPGSECRVQEMWDYLQHHPCARMSINCINVFMRKHKKFNAKDVASFLKRFIKTIAGNEPIITHNCYAPLVDLFNSDCPSHLIGERYRHIIGQLLVPSRRLLLERLCIFLRDFSEHEAKTQMNSSNLALCFVNLMQGSHESDRQPKRKSTFSKRISRELTAAQIREVVFTEQRKSILCASVIEALIRHSGDIFAKLSNSCPTLPSDVIRKMHRCSSGYKNLNGVEYVSF